MKNLVKVLFAAMVLVALGSSAIAQTTDNQTATVTATVVNQLSVTKNNDIAFGNIVAGVIPSLNPQDGSSTGTLGGTKSVGKFTINGNLGSSVLVTFNSSFELNNQSGGTPVVSKLAFKPTVRSNATDDASTSSTYTSGTAYELTAGGDFFYVGGTIHAENGSDVVPTAAAGDTFSGSFTLTATYN